MFNEGRGGGNVEKGQPYEKRFPFPGGAEPDFATKDLLIQHTGYVNLNRTEAIDHINDFEQYLKEEVVSRGVSSFNLEKDVGGFQLATYDQGDKWMVSVSGTHVGTLREWNNDLDLTRFLNNANASNVEDSLKRTGRW